MKQILLIVFLLTIFELGFGQEFRGGIGLHPFQNKISWRTNYEKKHFWDFKLGYNAGSVSSVPFMNLNSSITVNWRNQILEPVHFYWGTGLELENYIPKFLFPLGVEFYPLSEAKQLGIGAEASPVIIFLGAGMTSTMLQGDIAVRYYFRKKE